MDQVIKRIADIAKEFDEIKKIVLFGSRARETNTTKSDYDIAVFPVNKNFEKKMSFLDAIDEIDTLFKIDIVNISDHTDPILLENIEKEGVLIMSRENKRTNYKKAVLRLLEALEECGESPTSLNRDGVIQRFEFSAELAWKACREYMMDTGYGEINGPKPVMKEALSHGIIQDSEGWMDILNDRNLTSHIYQEELADDIFQRIKKQHIGLLQCLSDYF